MAAGQYVSAHAVEQVDVQESLSLVNARRVDLGTFNHPDLADELKELALRLEAHPGERTQPVQSDSVQDDQL